MFANKATDESKCCLLVSFSYYFHFHQATITRRTKSIITFAVPISDSGALCFAVVPVLQRRSADLRFRDQRALTCIVSLLEISNSIIVLI